MQQVDFQLSSDFNQVEEKTGFELLPKGDQVFRAVNIELKNTKQGGGKYFEVTFAIEGGPFDGRKIFQNFNVVNQNPDAVAIGLGEIKAWFRACYGDQVEQIGQLMASHVFELEGVEFVGTVGIEKDRTGKYDDKNKISKFKPHGSAVEAPAQQKAPAFQQPQPGQAAPSSQGAAAPQTAASPSSPGAAVPSFLKK